LVEAEAAVSAVTIASRDAMDVSPSVRPTSSTSVHGGGHAPSYASPTIRDANSSSDGSPICSATDAVD
jgi:hypothetical protein